MAKFDPFETLMSVVSSLIGRMMLFACSGMLGLALGWGARGFQQWNDLSHPLQVILNRVDGVNSGEVLMWLFLWPIVSFGTMQHPWFFLLFVLTAGFVFVWVVYLEMEAPTRWCLLLVVMTSLLPVMSDSEPWGASAWLVLAAGWLGVGAVVYVFWRIGSTGGGGATGLDEGDEDVLTD